MPSLYLTPYLLRQAEELTPGHENRKALSLPSCSTLDNRPCILPGHHNKAGSVARGTGVLVQEQESGRAGSAPCQLLYWVTELGSVRELTLVMWMQECWWTDQLRYYPGPDPWLLVGTPQHPHL